MLFNKTKPHGTVYLIIPITPKTLPKINKIREELARKFGGGTYSRLSLPSFFVGYWLAKDGEGKDIIVPDELSITIVDVDIQKYPDYLDYFETFKKEKENEKHPGYLGEKDIWITVYNTHRIVTSPNDTEREVQNST